MNEPTLLSRDDFREGTFARDNHTCVFCDKPAKDAHHIIERRLWPDGGYYLENGASVCEEHHLLCEQTVISVEEVREACGIEKIWVPPHLYPDQPYDKWGNPIMPNGKRMRGELFFDESVQKILRIGGMLDEFTHWVKYPRTHHLPWSGQVTGKDRFIDSLDAFVGKRVIVTEKMDGENATLYSDHLHARSLEGRHHEGQAWLKNLWGSRLRWEIPQFWRVCGENLYAEHSIYYDALPTYFMGFSVWNERNVCLSWDETLEWLALLDIEPVPVLYDGIWDEQKIRKLWDDTDWERCEGYVVRVADEIDYKEFRYKVAKFVRPNHLQTGDDWLFNKKMVPNGLAKDKEVS